MQKKQCSADKKLVQSFQTKLEQHKINEHKEK